MALDKSAIADLLDALRAGGDLDIIREGLAVVLQALIDAEATEVIGADRYQRTANRTTHRNGSRTRLLSTKAGDVELKIPKLREGSFFPALLEPRRRIDRALLAVVMEAYVHGTSTRKVDDLVKALGVEAGLSKSEVSRICAELDGEVAAFRSRSLGHIGFPYVFLDATYLKARVAGRVVSRAVVIATGVTADGGREVLGLDVGDSEDGAFWIAFLRSLKAEAGRGAAGHLRRPHRPQAGHRRGHGRRLLAALSSPLPPQRARPRATRLGRDGGRGHPHHLRPAHQRRGHRPGRQGRRHARPQVPGRGEDADRRP
jgi:transposase-like protein